MIDSPNIDVNMAYNSESFSDFNEDMPYYTKGYNVGSGEIIYNDPNIQQGEPSSLNKGKKRALGDIEDSNLRITKKSPLDIEGVQENSRLILNL